MTARQITTKDTVAYIRKALRQQFPGIKFSVRSDRGSACRWVRVSWTDGPWRREVEAVTNKFRGGIPSSYGSEEVPSERVVTLDPATGPELVSFAVDGILVERVTGPETIEKVRQFLAPKFPSLTVEDLTSWDAQLSDEDIEACRSLGVRCAHDWPNVWWPNITGNIVWEWARA